jgi:hypothetical protein
MGEVFFYKVALAPCFFSINGFFPFNDPETSSGWQKEMLILDFGNSFFPFLHLGERAKDWGIFWNKENPRGKNSYPWD